jgi:hypothetical protein
LRNREEGRPQSDAPTTSLFLNFHPFAFRPTTERNDFVSVWVKAEAIAWLEKSFAERNSLMIFLKTNPMFDSLRDDPRYVELLERVGLSPAR